MTERSYSDADLVRAVRASRSWRGVLRELGLSATSSAAVRSVRRHAERLSLDHSHFSGGRRWNEVELASAIAACRSWDQVVARLDLSGGSSATALKGHATRLGLDFRHFDPPGSHTAPSPLMTFDHDQLPRAGSLIAATWMTLCGFEISWPLEPCRYDLLAVRENQVMRIQVKTTRYHSQGSWRVTLSTGGRRRGTYDPDDIDHFFVIDGDFDYYLIPVSVVAGLSTIHLSAYERHRLPQPVLQPT